MTFLAMAVNPLKILYMQMRVRSLILFALMVVYICFSLILFFKWVAPSLDGRTNQLIAADSSTYIYFADSLRSGDIDPALMANLFSFPNTVLCPVMLALVLKSNFAIAVANYLMFFLAIILLKKSSSFSTGIFVGLLLLNATTTISLLSVNKEIIDLLAVSIFFYAYQRHRNCVLLLAILLAFFNRFEVCIVMLAFLFAKSKFNPWHKRRAVTLVLLTIVLSVMLPLLISNNLNMRFEEARASHIVAWLDFLEMHYLYGVAVVPKILENLFGELINVYNLQIFYNFSNIANSYIVFFNNLATAVVLVILVRRNRFTLRSDFVYFSTMGWIIIGISLVIQPRYFYFAYVPLCLQAAQTEISDPSVGILFHKQRSGSHVASLPDHKEAAIG